MLDFTEILTLKKVLNRLGVECTLEPIRDGLQIVFPNGGDVAIHSYTYGHEEGLMESYGFPEDRGDITGNMTAAQVISRLIYL